MTSQKTIESALRAAPSKGVFLDLCLQHHTPDVIIDRAALRAYAATLKPLPPADIWGAYLGKNAFLKTDFRELAVSTVQQGGYLYPGEDGSIKCWAVGTDEVRALLDRVDDARAQNMLPGVQQRSPAKTRRVLRDHFNEAPYAAERLDRWAELAGPDNQRKIAAVLDDAREKGGKAHGKRGYHFDFSHLKGLCAALPEGLGEDPFMKKAALLCILFAGVAGAKKNPVPVTLDLIVPADWRDPQTLHNTGVLRYSDALVERLDDGALLDQSDPYVTQIRVATVAAGHMTMKHRPDLTLQDIDGAWWFAGRLFDGPAETLSPEQGKIRTALESIAASSPFSAAGYLRVAKRAMNVATLRF